VILLLMVYVNNGKRADSVKSADEIIKPVGQLNIQDANPPAEVKTGG